MPSLRPSRKDAHRQELEDRLGEPVLSRSEAAVRLGTTSATLNADPERWPAFFSKGPRQVAFYPESAVQEFVARGRDVCRADKSVKLGLQGWPSAPPQPSADDVLLFLVSGDEKFAEFVKGTSDEP